MNPMVYLMKRQLMDFDRLDNVSIVIHFGNSMFFCFVKHDIDRTIFASGHMSHIDYFTQLDSKLSREHLNLFDDGSMD